MEFDAIVPAGGGARRLGGVDKPGLTVGDATLLGRVLHALGAAGRRVVVGPVRDLPPDVVHCREAPVGGGPLAAVAAGLPRTRADVVVVVAADLPWIAPAVPVLLDALAQGGDAIALAAADGRPNPLAAAWRRTALVAALALVGAPAGVAVRRLHDGADVRVVSDPTGWGADCDTWADVAEARRRVRT